MITHAYRPYGATAMLERCIVCGRGAEAHQAAGQADRDGRMSETSVPATIESVSLAHTVRSGESLRVIATYESAGTIGSLSFEVPVVRASEFYIGRALTFAIELLPF